MNVGLDQLRSWIVHRSKVQPVMIIGPINDEKKMAAVSQERREALALAALRDKLGRFRERPAACRDMREPSINGVAEDDLTLSAPSTSTTHNRWSQALDGAGLNVHAVKPVVREVTDVLAVAGPERSRRPIGPEEFRVGIRRQIFQPQLRDAVRTAGTEHQTRAVRREREI